MCFNPLITWSTAGLGLATGVFAYAKQKPATLYAPPAYFAFMEVLQGLMYTQLHHPEAWIVKILVYTAYVHVCFQPFVFNYWLSSFMGQNPIDRNTLTRHSYALKLCLCGAMFMALRMFIIRDVTPLCSDYEALCKETPSVFFGEHHVAWALPLIGGGWNYLFPSIFLHMFLFFIPSLLNGHHRISISFFLLGPYLAAKITSNPHEQSSIWCVIGLWLLVLTVAAAFKKMPAFLLPKTKL